MLYIVIFFFLVSVFLYCLLGGADFGAGIVELTTGKENRAKIRELVSSSIAPIWEANHIWIIITVVILFNAFPPVYSRVSTALYIPIILLLIGIVLRGSAFTFRHYDAIKDSSQEVYTKFFEYSSLIVTFFFGLIIGTIVSGKIMNHPESFYQGYIIPWLNLFSVSIGIFLTALFSFIAAVYLIGDSTDEKTRNIFIRKSKTATLIMVISGGLVFVSSLIEKTYFFERFFNDPLSIALIILATAALPILWKALSKGRVWFSRILAGAQLLFILGAFYVVYFPNLLIIKDSENLTFYNSSAPEITLKYLSIALLVGSCIIFPSLYFLYRIFKLRKVNETK
jgi:cytochrome bd ubiquinol oxidase subunit II